MEKPNISRKRHIAKAITWRIVGSIDTWVIGYVLMRFFGSEEITGEESNISDKAAVAATFIAGLELITKTVFYYFHERIWASIMWIEKQEIRHVVKTFSWRLVGAIDTILLVYIVYYFYIGSIEGAAKLALSMFSIEIVTKIVLYYLHERIWFTSSYGVEKSEGG